MALRSLQQPRGLSCPDTKLHIYPPEANEDRFRLDNLLYASDGPSSLISKYDHQDLSSWAEAGIKSNMDTQ